MSLRQNPKTIMQQHIHYSSTAEIGYDINVSIRKHHKTSGYIYDI